MHVLLSGLAHIVIGSSCCFSHISVTAAVLHAYHMSDGGVRDDAPRSSGHALKSISLLTDRPP